jgi:hypothetical protein
MIEELNTSESSGNERGAAVIETAIVVGLLLMLVLGSFEWGIALRDWMTVSSSTREGARAAASAGRLVDADCRILEATASALQDIPSDEIVEVAIYRSDTNGSYGSAQRYRTVRNSDPVDLTCVNSWYLIEGSYPHSSRDNVSANREWIGVRVVFDHTWETGFLWWSGTTRWQEDTIMRLEPALP